MLAASGPGSRRPYRAGYAFAEAPQPDIGPGNVPLEDRREALCGDHAVVEAEFLRERAVPAAGPAVLRVAPHVVPVGLEVLDRRVRGLEELDAGDHPEARTGPAGSV